LGERSAGTQDAGKVASPLLLTLDWAQRLDPVEVPETIQESELDEVLGEFSGSYQEMYEMLKRMSQEELCSSGVYAWTGEHAAADYIQMLTVELYDWVKSLVRKWKKRHAGEQLNKEVILERIRVQRSRLEKSLGAIPLEVMEKVGMVGEWSVKDLLAHLVEWERMFMGWYQAGLRGEVHDIPAHGYSWRDMDELNEHIYQKHRQRLLEDVVEDFRRSFEEIYAMVEAMPEEEMFALGCYQWVGSGNLVSYILANTANHYRWANDKLRAWRKTEEKI
jgi:hypothetical protein